MKILLVYRDEKLGDEFRKRFGAEKGFEIIKGDICNLTCDAIASPGNSKGDMGGGLDLAVRERFGIRIEKRLKKKIEDCFGGHLPIGTAITLPTDDPQIPWFISAPTMIFPGEISRTDNVEKAMQAILEAARAEGKIKKLAIPGLGTGVGGLGYEEAVWQMWKGYRKTKKGEGKKDGH